MGDCEEGSKLERKTPVLAAWIWPVMTFVLLWVGLGLGGYGIALRRFGMEQADQTARAAGGVAESEWEVRTARIHSVQDSSWTSAGIAFKLEGSEDRLLIPAELIQEGRKEALLKQFMRPGSRVRVRFRKGGLVVLELHSNPDTVYQRPLLTREESFRELAQVPAKAVARSRLLFVLSGICLLMAGGSHFFRGLLMKTFRKASTTGKL